VWNTLARSQISKNQQRLAQPQQLNERLQKAKGDDIDN
jgi:hypothetical protein